jgi:EmrB/QacA subfamily drug resistance transporter
VFLTIVCVGVDSTVLSVALPTLAKALHASESDLQWFSSGYFLVLAAAMLPAGLLGDRYGHKLVFLISLGLFGVGSAACAYSTSVTEFMAARVLLGIAGAGVIVMAISSLTVLFNTEERPKAVGILAAGNFLAMPIGPILGGWLLTNYWWGWVFLINVPIALIGLGAAAALLPEFRASERPGVDLTGVAASVAGLVAVTYGLIKAGQDGWGNPVALVLMFGGIAVLIGFFAWEHRLTRRPGGQPLLDMTLFDSASFTWGAIFAAMSFLALIGVLFTTPQYFQGVLGTTAMGSGLRLLPLVGGVLIGAAPAAQVARFVGAKIAVAAGFALLAVGLTIGATTSLASSGFFVAVWMAVVGAGMGLALATSTSAALVELSPERSGTGSGVLEAIDEVGGPWLVSATSRTSTSRACRVPLHPPSARAYSAEWRSLKGFTRLRCLHPCGRPLFTAWTWHSSSQQGYPSWVWCSACSSCRRRTSPNRQHSLVPTKRPRLSEQTGGPNEVRCDRGFGEPRHDRRFHGHVAARGWEDNTPVSLLWRTPEITFAAPGARTVRVREMPLTRSTPLNI